MAETTTQQSFSSRWVMMLAMLGMAVGTGNIWRFPRIAAQNGGGEFLVNTSTSGIQYNPLVAKAAQGGGFVIAHSMANHVIDARYAGNFILRRSIRLDPPYWMMIAVAMVDAIVAVTPASTW
mgnify:CR=1 FL=1